MSPKIKMSDIHDKRDDDIIELSDEELKEILADDDFDDSEGDGEIHSFVFSNPDPYAKVEPRPDDAPKREFPFDEKDNIVVKNPSSFWLPDVKIVDERFAMMSKNYTEEQKDLKAEVKGLQQQIHEQEQQAENIEQFVQRVKRNSTLTELTPYALRELVKAVYVDAPDKSSGKRRQKVHIEYDLVGYIHVDELLKAEQA